MKILKIWNRIEICEILAILRWGKESLKAFNLVQNMGCVQSRKTFRENLDELFKKVHTFTNRCHWVSWKYKSIFIHIQNQNEYSSSTWTDDSSKNKKTQLSEKTNQSVNTN